MFSLLYLLVSTFVNCPAVISLPTSVLYLWGDTSSETMSPGPNENKSSSYKLLMENVSKVNPPLKSYISFNPSLRNCVKEIEKEKKSRTVPPFSRKTFVVRQI